MNKTIIVQKRSCRYPGRLDSSLPVPAGTTGYIAASGSSSEERFIDPISPPHQSTPFIFCSKMARVLNSTFLPYNLFLHLLLSRTEAWGNHGWVG
eukprot:scaffold134314_cov56-Attheya_sp.AAC.2